MQVYIREANSQREADSRLADCLGYKHFKTATVNCDSQVKSGQVAFNNDCDKRTIVKIKQNTWCNIMSNHSLTH